MPFNYTDYTGAWKNDCESIVHKGPQHGGRSTHIEEEIALFWLLFLVGLSCGFVDTSLGMGYGVTSATVLLVFGMAPSLVSASVHAAEAVVDSGSAYFHHKLDNVDRHLLPTLLIPGVIASVLGALVLSWLALDFAKNYVRIVLIGMGILVLARHVRKSKEVEYTLSRGRAGVAAFIAAFLDITGGGGWGPVMTPTLILNGAEPRKAIGTVEFTEPFVSTTAVIVFMFTLSLDAVFLWTFLPLLFGGLILTPVGARLAGRIPKRTLGLLVGAWLIVLNVYGLLA